VAGVSPHTAAGETPATDITSNLINKKGPVSKQDLFKIGLFSN
jgi:hypothetical protein